MEGGSVGHNIERDPPCQAWFNLVQGFQRRRFKCESLRRTTTDAKWWQKLTWPLARRAKKKMTITIRRSIISWAFPCKSVWTVFFWVMASLSRFIRSSFSFINFSSSVWLSNPPCCCCCCIWVFTNSNLGCNCWIRLVSCAINRKHFLFTFF